jgi:hypothetical protein
VGEGGLRAIIPADLMSEIGRSGSVESEAQEWRTPEQLLAWLIEVYEERGYPTEVIRERVGVFGRLCDKLNRPGFTGE